MFFQCNPKRLFLIRYEGEFLLGWIHGLGVFWRADGMRHEGEFRGGKIWGLGKLLDILFIANTNKCFNYYKTFSSVFYFRFNDV